MISFLLQGPESFETADGYHQTMSATGGPSGLPYHAVHYSGHRIHNWVELFNYFLPWKFLYYF